MNETPIQHNDYACEMWKEITENAMKDGIELRAGFLLLLTKWYFVQTIALQSIYFFSHSISLLLHFRSFNAVCRLFRFQSLPFSTFCIWMDLNSYECVFVCMWTRRWRRSDASSSPSSSCYQNRCTHSRHYYVNGISNRFVMLLKKQYTWLHFMNTSCIVPIQH